MSSRILLLRSWSVHSPWSSIWIRIASLYWFSDSVYFFLFQVFRNQQEQLPSLPLQRYLSPKLQNLRRRRLYHPRWWTSTPSKSVNTRVVATRLQRRTTTSQLVVIILVLRCFMIDKKGYSSAFSATFWQMLEIISKSFLWSMVRSLRPFQWLWGGILNHGISSNWCMKLWNDWRSCLNFKSSILFQFCWHAWFVSAVEMLWCACNWVRRVLGDTSMHQRLAQRKFWRMKSSHFELHQFLITVSRRWASFTVLHSSESRTLLYNSVVTD